MLTTEPKVEQKAEVKNHPIIITLGDTVSGAGFLAGVTLSGRALMRQEDDGKWWMYGVRPAAIAESGTTIDEAFLRFRQRYKETLFDIAQESRTFEEFKAEVERFFYESDQDEQVWETALRAVRKCGDVPPPPPFSNLKRESPELRPSAIGVERLDRENKRFTPSDNVTDNFAMAQAA
ncbi:MAG TPA: hypothetical protein VMT67_12315 [Terriglobales bacterium]|nr:hypothetical protein [Terriglobales bacterium]